MIELRLKFYETAFAYARMPPLTPCVSSQWHEVQQNIYCALWFHGLPATGQLIVKQSRPDSAQSFTMFLQEAPCMTTGGVRKCCFA